MKQPVINTNLKNPQILTYQKKALWNYIKQLQAIKKQIKQIKES